MVYKLFIQQYDFGEKNCETKIEYVLAENKKELFAYIGYLYSTQICKIERIDYFLLSGSEDKYSDSEDEKIEHIININEELKLYEREK